MPFILLFSHGSPQTLHTVTAVSSLAWNHCCKVMIKKLLVLPFPASRIKSSHAMAGSSKTSPCQLGFLPQVCQLLTIYMSMILLPGRVLRTGAKSFAWDTKTGPGRNCPTSLGPDSCRTWRATSVTEEWLQAHQGQWPGGRKKEKQPFFAPPISFRSPIYSGCPGKPYPPE